MMKFYKKKEISLEKTPILFRLERRHTLLDGGKHESSDDESRRASRANSVGSYTNAETPKNMKRAATLSKLCLSDNSSNFSAASVVITESELSSSWLYKARKAKIDSDEENLSSSSNIPTEDNDMQPVPLRDPALKPVPVPLKPRKEKVSSCCCYVLVALTICIASLGIMAAIAGIVYLEVFAAYKEISEGKHANQLPSLDASIGRNGEIGGSLQNKIMNEDIVLSSSEANFNNENLGINKNNEDVSNVEDKSLNPVSDEFHKEVTDAIVTSDFDPGEQSNVNQGKDFLPKEVEDLEQNISRENNSSSVNFLLENQDEIEINGFSKDNSNFDGLDPNHPTNLRFPEMEQEVSDNTQDVNEDNTDTSETDNSFNENEDYENAFGFESQSRNLFGDDSLEELIMNRPIVEAKPPIEFLKRLVSNQNEGTNPSVADMDRKFSLSEILKHLRTLDGNNRLPLSRQKDVVTERVRVSSYQDVGSERNEYLNNLRRKIYE